MANRSDVQDFVLLGFPGVSQKFHAAVFLSFFIIYNITLFSNGLVLGLTVLQEHLHQPMYIIIGNLALSDLICDTLTLPKIIARYSSGDGSLSFVTCFLQVFFVHNLGALDSFILMLMAMDRLVAICRPLHYHSIMTNKVVSMFCLIIWWISSLIGLGIAIIGARLPYCGPNKVRNCFCSLTPVAILSCADSTAVRRSAFTIALVVHLLTLSFIIFSYTFIIWKIHRTARLEGWQKLFYTCTTHWLVIFLYFVPRLGVYSYNQFQLIPNADVNILLISIYTFVPHFTSPIIYCLRTEEIRNTMRRVFQKIASRSM